MSAMLAAHLILHPQLTKSLKVLATTVGRDKVRLAWFSRWKGTS
jgi:hypothetical protein